jgi:hypothetical protein
MENRSAVAKKGKVRTQLIQAEKGTHAGLKILGIIGPRADSRWRAPQREIERGTALAVSYHRQSVRRRAHERSPHTSRPSANQLHPLLNVLPGRRGGAGWAALCRSSAPSMLSGKGGAEEWNSRSRRGD